MRYAQIDDAVQLIRLEYLEMPGLTLTDEQAQRLWNFPGELCRRALEILTEARFLTRTQKGLYVLSQESVQSPDAILSRRAEGWRSCEAQENL